VGDYVRRLAGELNRQGHTSVAIAVHDPHIYDKLYEVQQVENNSIPVLRLPTCMDWSKRSLESQKWLTAFNPDWISLQYVPFGFQKKGLCFILGKRLASINTKALWQVMFHELWLGLSEKSSFKYRIWGALQKLIIQDVVKRLRPRIVHTQAEPHRITLNRIGIDAGILPLFGNIPYVDGDGWNDLLKPLLTKALGEPLEREVLYLAGVFGGVHSEWNPEETVNAAYQLVQRFQKRLVVVFHGKSNMTAERINKLGCTLKDRADVLMTGEMTNGEISKILQCLDLGLATSPRQLIQKSGSVAAMLEHGLPILVTRNDWRLRGTASRLEEMPSQMYSSEQFRSLTR